MIGAALLTFDSYSFVTSHGVRIWRAGKLRAWKIDVIITKRKYNAIEKYIHAPDSDDAISDCPVNEKI
jgi:hypothetical protein